MDSSFDRLGNALPYFEQHSTATITCLTGAVSTFPQERVTHAGSGGGVRSKVRTAYHPSPHKTGTVLYRASLEKVRNAYPTWLPGYLASYPDHQEWEPEPVRVHQLGFFINGNFLSPKDNERYKFTGNVTSSKIVSYQFRPENPRLNDYGNGLIRLNRNGDGGEGYVLFLSKENEYPEPVRIVVKKISDK